jgi:hypothetical protein
MADVSVEFGAKDTGLEATLKTVQAEISRLETEVNSGTLSFEEIAKKMREIKQSQGIFTQLGGEVESASTSVQKLKEQMRLAESITKANRSAIEIYSDTVDDLQKHLDAGTISQKTYASAIEKAEAALKSATPQTEEAKQANRELEEALKKAEQETRSLSEEQKKAEAITKSNRSATQIYNDEVSELHKHLNEGRISMETFATAVAKADAKLSASAPQIGKDALEMGDNVKKGSDKGGMSLGELAKASGVAGAAFAAGMAVFNTAMAGVQAVAASFGNALNLGGQLADLSAQTGVAAGELLVLQRSFDNTGAGAEKVSPAIAKMSSSIVDATSGTGAAAKAFDQLGLSASELINLPAEQQFQKIGNALAGVANETQRSALASDVFGGKLGKDLLPLMTNFSGETRTANQQLGSMVGVMNESSDAFDAIGDGIKVAQGKLTEFAAGLMSVMAPAIEAVVTALTRIDAAQIGKDLGMAFVGAGEAMKGFQSAVDAFEAGNISLALRSIFESVKLQAMETGNSIVSIFTAAFQTAGDILGEIFSTKGATFMLLQSSFDFIAGYAKDKIAGAMSEMFASMGPAFAGISASLKEHSDAGALAAELALQRIPIAAELSGEQIATILGGATEKFQANLAAANGEFFNTEEQAKKVAAVAEEINTATGKHPALIKDAAQEMRDLIDKQAESTRIETAKLNAAADIAEAKMRDVEMQIQLNNAIATGNTAEQARLEAIIAAEKGTERIKTLTEEYAKVMPAEEAARLANEIYRSEANMLAAKKATTDTKTEVGTLGNLLAGITEVKVEDPIKKLKEESKQAQTELNGISQILKVDITGGSPVDMMKKLGLDSNAITGSQNQLDAIKGAINILKGADPADLTPKVDKVGVQDNIDAIQTYIQTKLGGTTTANIEATADKNAADNAAGVIKQEVGSINSNITTQTDDNNIASTRATIEQGVAGIPLTFTVDPEQIKRSIGTIDVGGGAGGGVLSSIETLVSTIQGYVETIKDRLPMTALA